MSTIDIIIKITFDTPQAGRWTPTHKELETSDSQQGRISSAATHIPSKQRSYLFCQQMAFKKVVVLCIWNWIKHIFRYVLWLKFQIKKMATQSNKFQLLNPLQSLYVFYAFATTMVQQFVTPSFTVWSWSWSWTWTIIFWSSIATEIYPGPKNALIEPCQI